ncbi:protein containg BNR repeat-like domain [Longilinea arvoryzae]|uniref:Protein containg BNR repeat-like domain n=1 Tax=Longilinea arvoryzae TaxID=360412 RepID=A0A0S7BGZ2_9CHLR|nr:sialidase family protein [Longilinea arvoryzae]GAP13448.1 protein containg BNR repeat-like domain [Longilinea arvoryzae]
MHSKIRHMFGCLFRLLGAACLGAGLLGGMVHPAQAQASIDGWSQPVNLSNSGETQAPIITADSSGVFHAFWLDRQAGFLYSHTTSTGWTKPRPVIFPVSRETILSRDLTGIGLPVLISAPRNREYLFWQSDGGLRYSVGSTANGRTLEDWQAGGFVSSSVADYDAMVDADGVLHLAYVQPEDLSGMPAGVYYLRSLDSGGSWSSPRQLYSSSYYRSLLQLDLSTVPPKNSVDIAVNQVGDEKTVFVAFDNQPRNRVLVARSLDGGTKWEEAVEVDGPSVTSGVSSPGDIHVSALGKDVVLTWQVKQSDTVCFSYFRSSSDSGSKWSANQRMNTPFPGCADQTNFITGYGPDSVLVTSASGLVYLSAWNGEVWSDYYLQPSLSSFTDPEALDTVTFGLTGFALSGTDQLVAIGFDSGSGKDTWVLTRSLKDIPSWFPSQLGWKAAETLQTLNEKVSDLQIVGNGSQRLHAFWTQDEILTVEAGALVQPVASQVVYYSYLENNRWSVPTMILRARQTSVAAGTAAQTNDVARLSVAMGPDDRLWAVWQNSPGGDTYFSWARASAAGSVNEWSASQAIATIPLNAGGYSVVIDRGGVVNVVYSVPVNEGRGVFLVQSWDQGATWSNPIQIFDGAAAGWQIVSNPVAAVAVDGSLYVLFGQQSAAGFGSIDGLSAAFSKDRGAAWSGAESVTTEQVLWYQVLAQDARIIHRFWMEKSADNQILLLHQFSGDGGVSWGRVERISDSRDEPRKVSAVFDSAGRIHLVQLIEDQQTEHLLLEYWLWDGESWNASDNRDLGAGVVDDVASLSTGITLEGALGTLLSRSVAGNDPYHLETMLLSVNRLVEVPKVVSTALPPLPTETALPLVKPTATQAPTPTIDSAVLQQGSPSSGGGTLGGLIIGLIASVLVVGGGFGYAFFRLRKRNGG